MRRREFLKAIGISFVLPTAFIAGNPTSPVGYILSQNDILSAIKSLSMRATFPRQMWMSKEVFGRFKHANIFATDRKFGKEKQGLIVNEIEYLQD